MRLQLRWSHLHVLLPSEGTEKTLGRTGEGGWSRRHHPLQGLCSISFIKEMLCWHLAFKVAVRKVENKYSGDNWLHSATVNPAFKNVGDSDDFSVNDTGILGKNFRVLLPTGNEPMNSRLY